MNEAQKNFLKLIGAVLLFFVTLSSLAFDKYVYLTFGINICLFVLIILDVYIKLGKIENE